MKLTVDCITSTGYPDKFTIGDLLKQMDVETVPWLIISVNDIFYRRDKFDETFLNDGDKIELIYVRGGG